MLMTRFDPFQELRSLEKRFARNYLPKEEGVGSFVPKVNTREDEFAYHVDVDLPGVKKEAISVDVKEGQLVISGERNFKEEVKEEDYYKVETRFGKFSRTFTLPEHADVENITAVCENGVLEVTIPKLEEKINTKTIEIQ
jgi:HSP20 family protein